MLLGAVRGGGAAVPAGAGGPGEDVGPRPPGRGDHAQHPGARVPQPEPVQGGGQPAQRRARDPREDAGQGPRGRRRHAQQPRRAARQAQQVPRGRAAVPARARDPREGQLFFLSSHICVALCGRRKVSVNLK